ncbi:MAG TPA: sugar ABC transporter permease [Casimicrobiaceae bacterium]|nr:sugar ABC transporter permease [Casimicrobiaceae bacterium]
MSDALAQREARSRRARSLLARRERRFAYALLAPAVLAVGGLIAWPMYLIVSISFREGRSLNFLALDRRPLGLGNYRSVLGDPATWHSVLVSVVYTLGTLVPALVIGLATALLLNRAFPLRRWLRSLMLLPWAVPGVMVSIVFLWMFDASFGVVNHLLRVLGLAQTDIAWYSTESTALFAVIVPTIWKAYPFFTLTLLAAMQSIPGHLYEAAEVDGATAPQRFANVTWPGIRGPAVLAVVLNGLWTFREFDIIFAATGGGPAKATETLGIRAYNEAFGYFYMGRAAVIGVLMLLMALLAVLLARRALRREFFA